MEVQCNLVAGLPKFVVVGLPDKAVAESRERVRAAMAAIGLALPPKHIILNLSPADLPKEGSHFDLAVALALLAAMGVVDAETLSGYVVVGELALDGRIAPSPGVLLAALHAAEDYLVEENVYVIPLFNYADPALIKDGVSGYRMLGDTPNFSQVVIEG